MLVAVPVHFLVLILKLLHHENVKYEYSEPLRDIE